MPHGSTMSVIAAGLLAAQAGVAMAGDVDFVRDVQPILSSHCYQCHGPDESSRQAGLRLDSGPAAYEGVDGRPAVAPHHPEESELIRRVFADDPAAIMPPPDAKHPLTPRQKQTLRDWVAAGGAYAPHWSFAAPVRHEPPQVRNAQWVRDDLDRFILHELEAQNLTPSPEADLHTLIRRVSFDLVGLAPTPDEVRAFIDDAQATSRDQAYARLVDRLLASPHFGERWGRHWLDVARYADSDGYERDYQRPGAWHWRAWVIDSFNRDQPYDEFVLEQIAGDMLPDATADQRLASAFHRNELHNTEGGIDVGESNWRKAVGQVNAVGAAFMGLTVACAECHSHKHDPLTQREYYEMLAFFYGQMEERDIPAADFADASKRGVAVKPGTREGDSLQKYLDGDWYHVVVERERPRATHVRVRGVYTDKGDRVEAGTPAFLPPLAARDDAPDRLDLARWLASREHPLTARVAVNRIWARLMGVGIVATVDDLGAMGDQPSHPELLDTLAVDFMDGGWSRKAMIRRIVLSATYRQSSAFRTDVHAIDPDNRLFARQYRQRIEAELVRDHALRAAGLLRLEPVGGPSFRDRLPREMLNLGWGNRWEVDDLPQIYRRGIYMAYQRNTPVPMLPTFDAPDASIVCASRESSNTPLQTLTLWNAPIFLDASRGLGLRIVGEVGQDAGVDAAIERLFMLCMTRPPTDAQRAVLADLYEKLHAEYRGNEKAARKLVGDATLPDGATWPQAAAWIATARAMLSIDHTYERN